MDSALRYWYCAFVVEAKVPTMNKRMLSTGVGLAIPLALVIGCTSHHHVAVSPNVRSLQHRYLSGLVTLDGRPVRYFGVTVSRREDGTDLGGATAFSSSNGQFKIAVAEGVQYVKVAGPGFAAEPVKVTVREWEDVSPIVIEVTRGQHRIEGTVTDEAGRPMTGALIELSHHEPKPRSDALSELSRGNYRATSDASGHFVIYGVKLAPKLNPRLAASVQPLIRRSLAYHLSEERDYTVDLVVLPVGEIFGMVTPLPEDPFWGIILVQSVASAATLYGASTRADGTFTIPNVPAGEWVVSTTASDRPAPRFQQRVTVRARQRTNVKIDIQ
jgi:hypothetical protein